MLVKRVLFAVILLCAPALQALGLEKPLAPITLTADSGQIAGFAKLEQSAGSGGSFIDQWQGAQTAVAWKFSAPSAGEYEVEVVYACDVAEAGGSFAVVVGKERQLKATVEETGGPTKFKAVNVGTVTLEAGANEISLATLNVPKSTLMSLSRVSLRPPAGAAPGLPAAGSPPSVRKPVANLPTEAIIRGLAVIHLENGKYEGSPSKVIATIKGRPTAPAVLPNDCGPEMRAALVDAESYVRGHYPESARGGIVFDFEHKGPKDGRSAGAAFAVLLRSLAQGYQIDPVVCITGDISEMGDIKIIGGVADKLRGGGSNGAKVAVIPADNVTAIGDLLVASDRAMVLANLQVFSVTNVDGAAAVARADRAPRLAQAMAIYSEVQAALAKQKIVALRTPKVQSDLKRVLELAPNHVTAQYALSMALNKGPESLTRTGSIVEVFAAGYPVTKALDNMKQGDVLAVTCPAAMTRKAKADILALKRITHPEVEKLRKSFYDIIDVIEKLANAKQAPTKSDWAVIKQRSQTYDDNLKSLGSSKEFLEKMMKEGY